MIRLDSPLDSCGSEFVFSSALFLVLNFIFGVVLVLAIAFVVELELFRTMSVPLISICLYVLK